MRITCRRHSCFMIKPLLPFAIIIFLTRLLLLGLCKCNTRNPVEHIRFSIVGLAWSNRYISGAVYSVSAPVVVVQSNRENPHSRSSNQRPNRSDDIVQPYSSVQMHTAGGSTVSIDHYSDISQKTNEDDEQKPPYENLDPQAVIAIRARPPAVYTNLNRTLPEGS